MMARRPPHDLGSPPCSPSLLIALTCCLLVVGVAIADQSDRQREAAEAQNPAPVSVWQVDGGYRLDLGPGDDDRGYYRVSYKGALIDSAGTPFKKAAHVDLAAPLLTTAAGDASKLTLRFEDGTGTLGGGLFEAAGVETVALAGLEPLRLRGTALVAGDLDADVIQLAVGLESAPMRLPGLCRARWTNWLVLGANAQRQEATDAAANDDTFGVLTYRAFAGKAFGWRKSASPGATALKLADAVLEQAPDFATAQAKKAEIETGVPADKRTTPQLLLIDAVAEAEDEPAAWPKTVRDLSAGHADAITDQATLALYAEGSGWYSLGGEEAGKMKSLLTANLDYWFLPNRDDVLFRVRYENGFERGTPDDYKNQLMASVILSF